MYRLFCFILGLLWALTSPWLGRPDNFGGALLTGHMLLLAAYSLLRTRPLVCFDKALVISALILCFNLAFVTDELLLALNWLCISLAILYLLIERSLGIEGVFAFVVLSARNAGQNVVKFFRRSTLSAFLPPNSALERMKLSPQRILTLPLSLLLLLVFHLLFAQVNAQYETFVGTAVQLIWEWLSYLVDIRLLLSWALSAYVLYVLLADDSADFMKRALSPLVPFKSSIVLFPLLLLFVLFVAFQLPFLFTNYSAMAFKDLSLYTQKGFWELLTASALAYTCWLLFEKRVREEGQGRRLLIAFSCVQILLPVFSAHKLFLLQVHFGLKDQRILASGAVGLILFAFVMMTLQVLGRTSAVQVFRSQLLGLLLFASGCALLNPESLFTQLYPIRYVHESRAVKDYSYLLSNSFDNVSSWPDLMHEYIENAVPHARDYYWGNYASLCAKNHLGYSPFQRRLQYLYEKYQNGINLFSFNTREYEAWIFLNTQSELVRQFEAAVSERCGTRSS